MNGRILIIRNTKRENPGLIENVLNEHGLEYHVIDFDHTKIPEYSEYAALIVLGGPESANDKTAKMSGETAFIRNAIQAGLPYLGVCLGLQIFVRAMGGNVVKCKHQETGFRDQNNAFYKIRLTPEGRKDRIFANLPDVLPVFQLHGETVELTPAMSLLATGEGCKNQVVRFGNTAYGIQCHFELTDEMLGHWIDLDPDLRKLDAIKLRSDYQSVKEDYMDTAFRLFNNFLRIAGLI